VLSVVMLATPGAIPMAWGAPLLGGLELAGPYMFLLAAGISTVVGWGILRQNRWARRAGVVIASIGVATLLPSFSGAVLELRIAGLILPAMGVIVRVLIIFYLFHAPSREFGGLPRIH